MMKLQEIAGRIAEHLKRFEADPKINKRVDGTTPYYHAYAWPAGSRVGVKYVSYQIEWYLTKAEAVRYLDLLDGGAVGQHHILMREDWP